MKSIFKNLLKYNFTCLVLLHVILSFLLFFQTFKSYSQEIPIHTQFTYQDFIINPSLSGNTFENIIPIYVSFRDQWSGFDGGNPRTITLGGHGLISKNIGLGGRFFSDKQGGAFSKFSGDLRLSYNFKIANDHHFRLGLGGSIQQYQQKFILDNIESGDNLLTDNTTWHHNWSFGFSYGLTIKEHLINIGWSTNDLRNLFSLDQSDNRPKDHLFREWHAYVSSIWNDKIYLNLLIKGMKNLPVQNDIIAQYKLNIFKVGLFSRFSFNNYQALDAFGPVLNVDLRDNLTLGYSCDFTSSGLQGHSRGSHEIVLNFKIPYKNTLIKPKNKSHKVKEKQKNKGSSKNLGIESIEIKTGDDTSDIFDVKNGVITYLEGRNNLEIKGSMIDGSIKGFRIKINSSNNNKYCFNLIPFEIVNGEKQDKGKEISTAAFPTDINDDRLDKNGYLTIQPKYINDEFVNNRYKLQIYDCKNESKLLEIILKIKR